MVSIAASSPPVELEIMLEFEVEWEVEARCVTYSSDNFWEGGGGEREDRGKTSRISPTAASLSGESIASVSFVAASGFVT